MLMANFFNRYQHSKAAQELAEIRRALNSLQTSGPQGVYKQNLPLPPIPKKDLIYQAPSVVSSNSCSTENKYETIGKVLQITLGSLIAVEALISVEGNIFCKNK